MAIELKYYDYLNTKPRKIRLLPAKPMTFTLIDWRLATTPLPLELSMLWRDTMNENQIRYLPIKRLTPYHWDAMIDFYGTCTSSCTNFICSLTSICIVHCFALEVKYFIWPSYQKDTHLFFISVYLITSIMFLKQKINQNGATSFKRKGKTMDIFQNREL